MNRQEKSEQVGSLKQLLEGSQLTVVAEYTGLKVSAIVGFRSELRKASGQYRVVKNTLAKLATKGTELEGLHSQLTGPVGVVFTQGDAAGVAKAVTAFAKANPAFKIKGGVLAGGHLVDAVGIDALANLPGREQLLGMLLGALNGVPRQFVSILAAGPSAFVRVLDARRGQLAGEA